MFNTSILDVATGLVFIYLLLGLVCTTVNEWIAQALKTRAGTLEEAIRRMLHAPPDGTYLFRTVDINVAALTKRFNKPDDKLTKASGTTSVESVQKKLENWFNVSMDRASGLYKRKTQIWTIVIASAVTILANADTINIAQKLLINPTLREKIVQDATATAKAKNARDAAGTADHDQTAAPPTTPNSPGLTPAQKADLGDLTGWADELRTFYNLACQDKSKGPAAISACVDQVRKGESSPFSAWDLFKPPLWTAVFFPWLWIVIPAHLVGWALTATAASLGAPFWFDTLNKFMNVRSVGASPDEKKPTQGK